MPSDDVRQVIPEDSELAEEWVRETDDPDVLRLDATRWKNESKWPWQVFVAPMEFVRENPLEAELRNAIARALSTVAGVTEVEEEDREVWVVNGNPSGEALVRAASTAIDPFAERIRAAVEGS